MEPVPRQSLSSRDSQQGFETGHKKILDSFRQETFVDVSKAVLDELLAKHAIDHDLMDQARHKIVIVFGAGRTADELVGSSRFFERSRVYRDYRQTDRLRL